MGSAPSLLSIVSETSARPSGGRPAVPANTTSSILPPRSGLTPCSPMTQENASTTLDLPDPLGPTTQVIPRSNRSVVAEANDLNPRRVSAFRYTWQLSSSSGRPVRASVRAAAPAVFPLPGSAADPARHGAAPLAPYRERLSLLWIRAADCPGPVILCTILRPKRGTAGQPRRPRPGWRDGGVHAGRSAHVSRSVRGLRISRRLWAWIMEYLARAAKEGRLVQASLCTCGQPALVR